MRIDITEVFEIQDQIIKMQSNLIERLCASVEQLCGADEMFREERDTIDSMKGRI